MKDGAAQQGAHGKTLKNHEERLVERVTQEWNNYQPRQGAAADHEHRQHPKTPYCREIHTVAEKRLNRTKQLSKENAIWNGEQVANMAMYNQSNLDY